MKLKILVQQYHLNQKWQNMHVNAVCKVAYIGKIHIESSMHCAHSCITRTPLLAQIIREFACVYVLHVVPLSAHSKTFNLHLPPSLSPVLLLSPHANQPPLS